MALPPAELEVQRRLTAEFIDSDPTDLVLTPSTRVKQPSGSWKSVDGLARDSQRFKVITQADRNPPTLTVDGVERRADYIIMGYWDAILAPGDWWTDAEGRRYEVIELSDGYGYMTKAFVIARG